MGLGPRGKIAVVGLGLMGASLAMAIREARPDADLVGVDTDPRTLARARDRSLVKGAAWVLTRGEPKVEEVVNAVGAIPVVMEPDRHDRLVAGVSHVAFMLSVGYVLALAEAREWPQMGRLAGGGYRDMSRLAAGDP